jgi:TonB-dependent receptor
MKIKASSRQPGTTRTRSNNLAVAIHALLLSMYVASPVLAQDQGTNAAADATDSAVLEEVIVMGTRQVIQDSIEIKRDNVLVVDGLSANDIGELPALSIGEALESLTGVASHRENGGATEISIRGLGPYLSATTFNGREATNGSGDRSVNFSQFPSELMSKLMVYKTQSANLIEGGVAGVVALETLKPLDYGKQRFQVDMKGSYNPDQQDIDAQLSGDWGWRGTVSYVDQIDWGSAGTVGISLGYQKSDISQPEQEVNSSSPSGTSLFACINEPSVTNEGYFRSSTGDCEDQIGGSTDQGYNTAIDPATGKAYSDGMAFAFAPSSRGYKQNDTSDERDAFFAALQWQPNDQWDVNFDLEHSERTQSEIRQILNFANTKRSQAGVTGPSLITSPTGSQLDWTSTTAIESNSETYNRVEKYVGGGLDIVFEVNDRLTLSGDFSYSKTERTEQQVGVRLQSDAQDIFNQNTPGGYQPAAHWDVSSGIPQWTLYNFDVTDYTLFSDEYRVRIDSDVDRSNEIKAGRLDFNMDTGWDGIHSVEGGVRYSELTYLDKGATRYETGNLDDSSQEERDVILALNEACRTAFPERGFLAGEADGPLVTNIDTATGQTTSGTGNTWATFDTMCITNGILEWQNTPFAYPDQYLEDPATTDVTETTLATYLMANFSTELAGKAVNGNFGLRIVNTKVDSKAWRTAYEITQDSSGFYQIAATGDLDEVNEDHSYTEALPSFNAVMDLTDTVLLRGAVYRAMSRADPGDLGYNRSFSFTNEEDITDPDELITGVSGSGNPSTDPLMSWNFDTAIEWYPNEDSILTFGLYYKQFTGGFQQVQSLETFTVDGEQITRPIVVTETDTSTNTLWGFEVTAAHNFSTLPGLLSGLGVKIGYNYGDSDLEFEDSQYGDLYVVGLDGVKTQTAIGIVEPGNVPGFSEHVFSGVVYWGWGDFDASVIYKYRSEYFQPYTSDGTRLRYVGDVGVWEARMQYQIGKHISISLEGINLFDAPKEQYFFTTDNLGEVNVYGPRYFLGVRGKF